MPSSDEQMITLKDEIENKEGKNVPGRHYHDLHLPKTKPFVQQVSKAYNFVRVGLKFGGNLGLEKNNKNFVANKYASSDLHFS